VERIDVAMGPPRSVLVRVQRVIGGVSEPTPDAPKPAGQKPVAAANKVRPEPPATPAPADDSQHSGVQARTVVLLSGAALTIGAAAVGTLFAVRSGTDSDRIRDAQGEMPTRGAKYVAIADMDAAKRTIYGDKPATTFCREPLAVDAAFCNDLNDNIDKQRTDRRVRDLAFVGAGVLGIATIATVFLWRPAPSMVSLAPALNPSAPGFVVFGNF
jgi:hypothetical protein